jgi:preprotein translocase SecE subunit
MDATTQNLATTAANAAQTTAPVSTGTAAATHASTSAAAGNGYLTLIIWIVVVGAIFGFLWQRGYLARIRDYCAETQEELKKCTWPSVDELKGSTIVVMLTILMLGLFTVSVDWVLSMVIRAIT